MEGINAYDASKFHPSCVSVELHDIGGLPWLWCPDCGVAANMQLVSPKFPLKALPEAMKSTPKVNNG